MKTINKQWISAHLYYNKPLSQFLKDAVFPFVDDMKNHPSISHYFFIRYWEKGPHIRLRFLVKSDDITAIKKRLEVHFNDFFNEFPSQRTFEEGNWYPNDSVQWIPYEPEIERYYGPNGVAVSEKQFQPSSEAVKEIISAHKMWDYEYALGAAIQLHLGFAYAIGFSLREASEFFNFCFERWFPRAYYFNEKKVTREELFERKKATLISFNQNFDEQKSLLITNIATIWNGLSKNEEFQNEWLNQWVRESKTIHSELKYLAKKGSLTYPNLDVSKEHTYQSQPQWPLLDSYIHMTNNRLGLFNRDESFISYLLQRGLKEI